MIDPIGRIAGGLLVVSLVLVLAATAAANSFMAPPDPGGRAAFGVRFSGEYSPYPLIAAFVLPGESLDLEAASWGQGSEFLAEAEQGSIERRGPDRWTWTAPAEPGLQRITIADCINGGAVCVKAFVMVPYAGETELNGFPIGRYEVPPEDAAAYETPRGLVEVTPENESMWVSPHFQLRDFLCKQEGEYPKYVALRTRLLLKLEMLQEEVYRVEGPEARVRVMSAYRTPQYNASIGNRTELSRHLYGDAADVFIDRNGDDKMDDLDGDGRITTADAGKLFTLVDSFHDEAWYEPFVGGLGIYGPRKHRGPFVHIDTRGSEAHWGDKRGNRWLKANFRPRPEEPGAPSRREVR